LGEATEENPKPKRASLLRGTSPGDVDLDTALALLSLPREVGPHPETGQPIMAGIGRYGPYISHNKKFVSLKGDDDVLTIGLNRAITLLAEAEQKGGGSGLLRELGTHPVDGKPVSLNRGRFGPYVKHGKTMASLRKANDPETMSLEEAVELLDAKEARGGANAKGKGKGKNNSATTAEDTAESKKPAPKKTSSKKSTTKTAANKNQTKKTPAKKSAAKKTAKKAEA